MWSDSQMCSNKKHVWGVFIRNTACTTADTGLGFFALVYFFYCSYDNSYRDVITQRWMYWLNEEKNQTWIAYYTVWGNKHDVCTQSIWAKTHSHQIYIKYLNCSHEVDGHKIPQVLRRKCLFVCLFQFFMHLKKLFCLQLLKPKYKS